MLVKSLRLEATEIEGAWVYDWRWRRWMGWMLRLS